MVQAKIVFEDERVGCASCHPAAGHFSDGTTHLSMAPADGSLERYAAFERPEYRTPSLALVGGTAPYFHNGSVQTLEQLIDKNGDRMGRTSQLSAADRKALVAYLRTL